MDANTNYLSIQYIYGAWPPNTFLAFSFEYTIPSQ